MSSFLIGDGGLVSDYLRENGHEEAADVLLRLCELGLFHTLDEFECFRDFNTGRYHVRIHGRFSTEHHCSVCGVIQAGTEGHKCVYSVVGCGGILSPTISRDPPEGWGAPKPSLSD